MYERMNKFYVVDTIFRGRDIIRFLKKHSNLNKEKVEEIKVGIIFFFLAWQYIFNP